MHAVPQLFNFTLSCVRYFSDVKLVSITNSCNSMKIPFYMDNSFSSQKTQSSCADNSHIQSPMLASPQTLSRYNNAVWKTLTTLKRPVIWCGKTLDTLKKSVLWCKKLSQISSLIWKTRTTFKRPVLWYGKLS